MRAYESAKLRYRNLVLLSDGVKAWMGWSRYPSKMYVYVLQDSEHLPSYEPQTASNDDDVVHRPHSPRKPPFGTAQYQECSRLCHNIFPATKFFIRSAGDTAFGYERSRAASEIELHVPARAGWNLVLDLTSYMQGDFLALPCNQQVSACDGENADLG